MIPDCYDVRNVVPLQQKAASFSDETLFYIFYTMPRDIAQEVAASELYGSTFQTASKHC
jgi:CCR4-NOT transcription complex subunit 2